jgi:hypothetical protein
MSVLLKRIDSIIQKGDSIGQIDELTSLGIEVLDSSSEDNIRSFITKLLSDDFPKQVLEELMW